MRRDCAWITAPTSTDEARDPPRRCSQRCTAGVRVSEVLSVGDRLGGRSHGVVTATELRAAGVDPRVVSRLVSSGRWTRLWHGTYLTSPEVPSDVARAHAALKHACVRHSDAGPAPQPVVSGLAGARAVGLRWVPEGERVQVLVGPEVHRRSHEHVLVRRTADVAGIRPWSWHGVPLADPARLVVDGGRECRSLRDVRGLVLGAVADGRTTPAELHALLDAGAVGGTALTRRAVRDAERGAASPPEAELVDELVGSGLPFYANPDVRVDGRLVGRFDVYLVGTGVGGEMDSQERHGEREALDETLRRHERAARSGLELLHVTPARFRSDPQAFLSDVRRAVARRRSVGLGEPAGLELVPRGPLLQ